MGLRGAGATALSLRHETVAKSRLKQPWKEKGLARWERVVAFCESLKITAGSHAGRRVKLRPWQVDFIKAVYGTTGRARRRAIRTAVLCMARKNGKTALAAMLALCHLVGPEAETRGEVYSLANDRAQAGKIYKEMVAMLKKRPDLAARCNIIDFHKTIVVLFGDGEGSEYQALSSEVATKHGLSPSFAIYDELGQARNRDLYDAMDTAMGARDEPLMMVISTQAADDNAPMSELVDYGLQVNKGEIEDPSFHLTFYGTPDGLDPFDPATWEHANPALGDFRSFEDVERQARQAQKQRSKMPAFEQLILNLRVSAHVRAVSRQEWEDCKLDYDLDDFRGWECVGGLDLSAVRDLCSLTLAFQDDLADVYAWPIFFMPEGAVDERSEVDRKPYREWADRGYIKLIPGKTNDPAHIARFIDGLRKVVRMRRLNFDSWGMTDLEREFTRQGIPFVNLKDLEPEDVDKEQRLILVETRQGFATMGPIVKNFENLMANGRLFHPGNPVLNMCAANAVFSIDAAENKKFDKAKATGRIDGMVSLSMAARDARNPPAPKKPSVYETRGALVG